MKRFFKNLIIAILVFVVIAGIFSLTVDENGDAMEVSLSQVAEQVSGGQVEKIEVSENSLLIFLRDGTLERATKESESSFSETLANLGVSQEALKGLSIEVKGPTGMAVFLSAVLPFLIP